jgi:hypothetical protein
MFKTFVVEVLCSVLQLLLKMILAKCFSLFHVCIKCIYIQIVHTAAVYTIISSITKTVMMLDIRSQWRFLIFFYRKAP